MFLIIVGSGAMGQLIKSCAEVDSFFDEIVVVEPLSNNWPTRKADLIIDFSHPKAVKLIYDYCRERGGSIPVIMGTTGQGNEEEAVLELLEKICPVVRKSNFSKGIEAMNYLVAEANKTIEKSDIVVEETHHIKKIDSPSGTAKTLCQILGVPFEQAISLRMGTVPGEHRVCFAMDDEVLEIRHVAYSKKIFALGAIEEGKELIKNIKS